MSLCLRLCLLNFPRETRGRCQVHTRVVLEGADKLGFPLLQAAHHANEHNVVQIAAVDLKGIVCAAGGRPNLVHRHRRHKLFALL